MAVDRLTAFLYLVMRDELPTGRVKSLIEQVQLHDEFVPTAPELAALADRYAAHLRGALVPEEDDGGAGDEEEGRLVRIARRDGELWPEEGNDFETPMLEWLDQFDDRLTESPHFVAAVNEAALSEMAADEVSARLVAQRVQELAEAERALDEPVKGDETEEVEKGVKEEDRG